MSTELPNQLFFLPAEMSYKSVHRDFLAGLEEESNLRALKYDAFSQIMASINSANPNHEPAN